MNGLMKAACLVVVAALAFRSGGWAQTEPARDASLKLWSSLSDDQKAQTLRPFDDKERYKETFPPVKRPGLPVSKLSKEQAAVRAKKTK